MKFQQWLISDETKESIHNLHKKLHEVALESKKPTAKEMANFTSSRTPLSCVS
jgi:preprotein translocase subunit Sss1